MSEIVYGRTVVFCDRFISKRPRTHDQMVQAAWSEGVARPRWRNRCMIHQTNYLLDQQLRVLEKEFLKEGGFTERLYHAGTQARFRSRNR